MAFAVQTISHISDKPKSLRRKSLPAPRPVLLDGTHDAVLKSWCIAKLPGMKTGQFKAYLHWQLVNETDEAGKQVILRQFYNINVLANGQMEAGWSSNFMRDYATLAGGYPVKNVGLTPDAYADCIIGITTRKVSKGRGGKSIQGTAQYSVVDALTALVVGELK